MTAEQTNLLKKKIAEGATLGETQAALQAAGAHLTYMELRFLVDDLGLTVKEKETPKTVAAVSATSGKNSTANNTAKEDEEFDTMPEEENVGGVSVTMDSVVRAGAMVSGTAIFSDGTNVQWALDEMGRLGLIGAPKGYQPPTGDLPEFQNKLRALIESRSL